LGLSIIDIPPRMDRPGGNGSDLDACSISDANPGVAMTPVGVSVTPDLPRVNRPSNLGSIPDTGDLSDNPGLTMILGMPNITISS
jgi:hypothetical protein